MEPSYHVVLASFFVFDSRLSFFGRFQSFVPDGCSADSCDFGVFVRG